MKAAGRRSGRIHGDSRARLRPRTGEPHGRGRAQCIAVATRAFLAIWSHGQATGGTRSCRPRLRHWQLATTPRFLSDPDLARVLAACDGAERLRDRAIILLLARLGLRASEAAHLSFEQIDWADGRLTVAGKARREERLPLTQEVGDAIIAYVERARPRVATSARVFLTDAAPVVPLSRVAVKCIVRRALSRAGVESPHRGAHVLRHSAATAHASTWRQLGGRRRGASTPLAVNDGSLRQGGHHSSIRDRAALGREAAVLSGEC